MYKYMHIDTTYTYFSKIKYIETFYLRKFKSEKAIVYIENKAPESDLRNALEDKIKPI